MRALAIMGAAAIAALVSGGAQAQARQDGGEVFETPAGCQWLDESRVDQRMWCRAETGRMRPTGTVRRNLSDAAAGCPRGMLDDGLGCVSERQALAALKAREPWPLDYQPAPWTPLTWPSRRAAVETVVVGRYGAGSTDNGAPRDVVVMHRIRP